MTALVASYFLLLLIVVGILLWVGITIANLIDKAAKRMARMLVIIPEGLINPFKEHRPHEINLSQELYRRLGELKIPFVLETEVPAAGEEIHFFISVPRRLKNSVGRLIETLWSNGYVKDASDSESWHMGGESGVLTIGHFEQAHPYSVPIALARRGHFEPFTALLRLLSRLATLGEGAAIQWIVRPADPRLTTDVGALIAELNSGNYHISKHLHETFVITPETLKPIERKIKQPLFFVNGRVAAIAPNDAKSRAVVRELAAQIAGEKTPQMNHLTLVESKYPTKSFADFLEQSFDEGQTMVLNAEELATLFHMPGPATPIPKIRRR